MPPLGVIGPLSRDVVAGAPPRIGGGPWHATRALHTLRQDAVVVAKCGEADRSDYRRQLAALGLPSAVAAGGETTAFSFAYDEHATRTMRVDAVGEPFRREDVAVELLKPVEWLHVARRLRGRIPRLAGFGPLSLLCGTARYRTGRSTARGRRAMIAAVGTVDGVLLVDVEEEVVLGPGTELPLGEAPTVALPRVVASAQSGATIVAV